MKKSTIHTGLYTIDPFDSFARPAQRTDGYDALVTIAGLGGTGAFLAEDLARLLSVHFGWRAHIHLADHDRVEIQNTQRQAGLRGIKPWYAGRAEHAFEVSRQWLMSDGTAIRPYRRFLLLRRGFKFRPIWAWPRTRWKRMAAPFRTILRLAFSWTSSPRSPIARILRHMSAISRADPADEAPPCESSILGLVSRTRLSSSV
jgi:hypothetical protein